MLDRPALALLRPLLLSLARPWVRMGLGANSLTLCGFALGLLAVVLIVFGDDVRSGQPAWLALAALLLSRLMDGLDGTVARLTKPTDRGAFLDITLDFIFYASIPLAFALADPAANALPAAVLLASFIGTASSFLAFAVMAEKRGLKSTAFPSKGLYYLGGLTGGTETILCFVAMCLWPQHFAALAYGFAVLCGLTLLTRLWAGWNALKV